MKDELSGAKKLLAAQMKAGLDKDAILTGLFASTRARIESMSELSRQQITELTEMSNDGPWSDEQRKELANVMCNLCVSNTVKYRRSNQSCAFFENFVPQEKWREVKNTKNSLLVRAQVLAKVAASIGLINPTEPTLFRMVAILAYCDNDPDMSQTTVFDFMEKIKVFIKSVKIPKDFPYIVEYPAAASQLPSDLLNRAFPVEEDIPVEVVIPDLDTILAGKTQRGRAAEPAWLQHVPEEFRPMVAAQIMKSSGARASSSHQPASQPVPTEAAHDHMPLADTLRELRAKLRPTVKHEAKFKDEVKDELKHEVKDETKDDETPATKYEASFGIAEPFARPVKSEAEQRGTLEDMEHNLVAACKARDAAAKAKAKAKSKAKSKPKSQPWAEHFSDDESVDDGAKEAVKKRPAAAQTGVPQKRPAAAIADAHDADGPSRECLQLVRDVDMKDVFKRLRAARGDPDMYMNKFCSAAYSSARTRANNHGATVVASKEFGGYNYKRAKTLW